MQECDNSIAETIYRLRHEYIRNNQGIIPKSVSISKNIVELLKEDIRLNWRTVSKDKNEMTIFGLKINEVEENGVIKIEELFE